MFADIYLTGPSLRDKDKNNVPVTCLVVGFNISDLPVIWKVGGEVTSEGLTTLPLSENVNGTQSVRSELSLQASTWHGHAEVSCEVRRACDRDALARRISKAKGESPPTSQSCCKSNKCVKQVMFCTCLCMSELPIPHRIIISGGKAL